VTRLTLLPYDNEASMRILRGFERLVYQHLQ